MIPEQSALCAMDEASHVEGQAVDTDTFCVESAAIMLHEESAFCGLGFVDLDSVPCCRARVVVVEELGAREVTAHLNLSRPVLRVHLQEVLVSVQDCSTLYVDDSGDAFWRYAFIT